MHVCGVGGWLHTCLHHLGRALCFDSCRACAHTSVGRHPTRHPPTSMLLRARALHARAAMHLGSAIDCLHCVMTGDWRELCGDAWRRRVRRRRLPAAVDGFRYAASPSSSVRPFPLVALPHAVCPGGRCLPCRLHGPDGVSILAPVGWRRGGWRALAPCTPDAPPCVHDWHSD